MGREIKNHKQEENHIPLVIIFIFWFFVKIGDIALWVFKKPLTFPRILLQIISRFTLFLLSKSAFVLLRFAHFIAPSVKNLKNLGSVFKKPARKLATPLKKVKISRPKTEVVFVLPWGLKFRYFAFGFLVAFFFFFLPITFYFWLQELPSPRLLAGREIPQTTKIYDRSGKLLYEIYADQNRTIVPLSEIPKTLKEATIAIEDKDFYYHQGFDPRAIIRAARETMVNHNLQGGSTITQQLVKSALLTPEISLKRKIKEIVLAFSAERIYSKDQILEMYLNQVPYGGTAWGVEAAAQTYFGKHVLDLTLAEAALLAGLPAAPTTYSPFGAHPELAKARQEEVLKRMVEDGYIKSEEAKKAKEEKLTFAPQRTNIKAPHFVMYVKDQLVKKYGEQLVEKGGLEVTTTLDLTLQEKTEEIVQNEIASLKNLRVGNGAALIIQPSSGDILAMVGSKNYFAKDYDGNVNVALSLRQPGSSIKVVNYATALQNGFTPASILDDSPITYQNPGSEPYSPVNYDGKFHGKITLRHALANSYNVPAVKVLSKIGVKKMVETGRLMGITSWNDDSRFGLSLTLGGGDVTMLDMVKVYGVLANGGKKVELSSILEVKDDQGEILEEHKDSPAPQLIPPGVAFLLSQILSDNFARSAAFGLGSDLFIPNHTVAVKTGTTNDKRDNWTIGYTPSHVTAVWVGNNDNSPMNPELTSGVTGASPIWHKIMNVLLDGKENEVFAKPDDVVEVKICAADGLLSCEGCQATRTEYFLKGTEPKTACHPPSLSQSITSH